MQKEKGRAVGAAGPTQNDPPTKEPRAFPFAYTGGGQDVKRGREPLHIGNVLKPIMRRIVATERRRHFRLILGGKFPDAH